MPWAIMFISTGWRRFTAAAGLAVFAVTAPLLVPSAAASDQSVVRSIDDMIEHLREDPVLVQPSMGMGDTQGAHDLLAELAADVDVPVYVVLGEIPAELGSTSATGEQAAALLRAELGDGLYYVEFAGSTSYVGTWGEAADFELRPAYAALRRAADNGPGDYPRTSALFEAVLVLRAAADPGQPLPDEVVDADAEQSWAFIPTASFERADASAGRWVATIATVIAVLVGGSITTVVVARARPASSTRPQAGGRTRPNGQVPGRPTADALVPADIGERAREELDRARRRFGTLPAKSLELPQAIAAEEAIEAAEQVLQTGDELDAVGGRVLALIAGREVQRIAKPDAAPYRPCFINPMHSEARDSVRVEGSSIDAPVCQACRREQGRFLAVRTRWGQRPYVETRTVWARTGCGALVDNLARQVLDDRRNRR